MKHTLIRSSMLLMLLLAAGSSINGQLLVKQPVWLNPDLYTMNRSFANQEWGVNLFCRVYSGAIGYIAERYDADSITLYHSMSIYADPCWNRLVYIEKNYNAIRSYGSTGSGYGQFVVPIALDIGMPINNSHPFSDYYNIFVADRDNNRIERLRYAWTTPELGLQHVEYYENSQTVQLVDFDIDNNISAYPDWDDYLWVARANNTIARISTSTGAATLTYGGTGSGIGQFKGIEAIACGRSPDFDYANDFLIYVADAGNNRLVKLFRNSAGTVIAWLDSWESPWAGSFSDLEVDNFGQVWALSDAGRVFKLKGGMFDSLELLDQFGTQGTDTNQFNHPNSISNTGGYLGGGGMLITELWTNQSGIQGYAIGSGIKDLYAKTDISGSYCWCWVYFTLLDWSTLRIRVYDSLGTIVRELINTFTQLLASGARAQGWNGTNSQGQHMPPGRYCIEVMASSGYTNIVTGQPVTTMVDTVWVNLCEDIGCDWKIGDANGNTLVNIADPACLIQYIFGGGPAPIPHPVGSGDANCSRTVNIADVIYLISFIFSGGPPPGDTDGTPPPECTCADYD